MKDLIKDFKNNNNINIKKNSFGWSWSFQSNSHIFNSGCNKAFSTNSQSTLPAVAFSLPQNNSMCSAEILVFN